MKFNFSVRINFARMIVAFLFFATSAVAFDFKVKGSVSKSISDDAIRSRKSAAVVKIYEPHENQVTSYNGLPFNDLMDQTIGKSWRDAEEVLFTCADGYQPSIPVEKFKRFRAWLVWARTDGKPFQVTNKLHGNEQVKLGPYYLVWENDHNEELLLDGADDFPYQVVSVDLISFKDKFAKLAPPAGSKVTDGFLLYRKYCMKCHTLHGEGGGKGPELKSMDFVSDKQRAAVKRWILAPQDIKKDTTMPAFGPKLKDRDHQADKILDYLGRMTQK